MFDDLPTRPLGRTGEHVTTLGFGAMELRGEPRGRPIEDADVEALLNTVLDTGINLIDTSLDYGKSEERIGRSLAHRRSEYVLATKCGCPALPGVGGASGKEHAFDRQNLVAGIETSLRRLRTDHVDLVQLHLSPSVERMRQDDTIATLLSLRDRGLTRFIGMSGTPPHLADQVALGVFDVFQIPYSMLEQDNEALITAAAEAGAGVLVRGGAARGVPSRREGLAERYEDHAAAWERTDVDDLLDGMSPIEFTLRFTISHPAMSSTIVGTLSPDHVRANAAAVAKGPLPEPVVAEVKARWNDGSADGSEAPATTRTERG